MKTQQLHDSTGVLERLPNVGIMKAVGTTVPTDGSAGYAPGCLFIDTDGAAGSQFYINEGTNTSCDFNLLTGVGLSGLTASAAELNILDGVTATAAELNKLDDSLSSVLMSAGSGVSAAEAYAGGAMRVGGLITTRIVVDLTGLVGSATDLDIIGNTGGAASANFGQITAARNGTIIGGLVTCLEVPAGGADDIDFYSATVGTGAQDVDVTTLTETVLITSGAAWASGTTKGMTGLPAADEFLYIVNGEAVGGTFTAGKFLIELYGTP